MILWLKKIHLTCIVWAKEHTTCQLAYILIEYPQWVWVTYDKIFISPSAFQLSKMFVDYITWLHLPFMATHLTITLSILPLQHTFNVLCHQGDVISQREVLQLFRCVKSFNFKSPQTLIRHRSGMLIAAMVEWSPSRRSPDDTDDVAATRREEWYSQQTTSEAQQTPTGQHRELGMDTATCWRKPSSGRGTLEPLAFKS